MDKLKKVLNQNHGKDEANLDRSDSNRRRASKASSKGSKEAVEAVASPVAATSGAVTENNRRLSIKTNAPVQVSERRTSNVTPVSPVPIVKAESPKVATLCSGRPSIVTPLSPATIAKTESQKVATPVIHNTIKLRETEEIIRARNHERNIHHVQHHVQPVKDTEIRDEVHHNKVAPVTVINENFKASAEDAAAFESLGEQFKDVTIHAEPERKIIDLGEELQVQEHHHIHNVVQPVIQKETHDRHRIHTTVPIQHTTHEPPIIHASVNHEPLSMEEYLKRGGSLSSTVTHTDIGKVLLTEQRVDGVASTPKDSLPDKTSVEKPDPDVPTKPKA